MPAFPSPTCDRWPRDPRFFANRPGFGLFEFGQTFFRDRQITPQVERQGFNPQKAD